MSEPEDDLSDLRQSHRILLRTYISKLAAALQVFDEKRVKGIEFSEITAGLKIIGEQVRHVPLRPQAAPDDGEAEPDAAEGRLRMMRKPA